MRQYSPWPAMAAVGLSVAILAVVGCTGRTPPAAALPGSPSSRTTSGAEAAAPSKAKPLADWPEDLAGTLLISGEMVGYTEPCGCTAGQKGGLIRRLTFADMLRTERKWPVALIDLGSLINDPHGPHGGLEETKIRFDSALRALTMMRYSAIALSAEDLKLGADETLMRFLNTLPDAQSDGSPAPKIVAANVTPAPGVGFEKRVVPSVISQVGPIRLGITAVLDPAEFAKLNDSNKDAMLTVAAPEDRLPSVLADLEKTSDHQVLMVQGPPELAKRLGLAYPGFDIIVATTPYVDAPEKPETLNGGKTWVVTVGRKGQYLGAIGLPKDPAKPLLYHRITLDPRFDEYKSRGESMRKLMDEDFVADLKSADVLATYPKKPFAFGSMVATTATYIGAQACKSCHPNTFAKWETTKHAHAYDVLTNPKRNREPDADCVRCHTTGFEYTGGFTSATALPDLRGNQCENCHGPGSKHAAEPDDKAILKTIARSAADFEKNHRCLTCHDEDNSPHGFDFPTKWAQVMHKGLDRYDSPQVHKGITPPK